MKIILNNDLRDYHPDVFFIIHLVILCASLKYCTRRTKGLSFRKLSYLFDNTLKKDIDKLNIKSTFLPWNIEGYFKKALVLAEANDYITLVSNSSSVLHAELAPKGNEFIESIECSKQFEMYIELVKSNTKTETDFKLYEIGCAINEY